MQSTEDVNPDIGNDLYPVSMLIKMQLILVGVDAAEIEYDEFSLGYVFGLSNMHYFQVGGDLEKDKEAVAHMLKIFQNLFGARTSRAFSKAIELQTSGLFIEGRNVGATEMGDWFEANGTKQLLGLMNHYNKQQSDLSPTEQQTKTCKDDNEVKDQVHLEYEYGCATTIACVINFLEFINERIESNHINCEKAELASALDIAVVHLNKSQDLSETKDFESAYDHAFQSYQCLRRRLRNVIIPADKEDWIHEWSEGVETIYSRIFELKNGETEPASQFNAKKQKTDTLSSNLRIQSQKPNIQISYTKILEKLFFGEFGLPYTFWLFGVCIELVLAVVVTIAINATDNLLLIAFLALLTLSYGLFISFAIINAASADKRYGFWGGIATLLAMLHIIQTVIRAFYIFL